MADFSTRNTDAELMDDPLVEEKVLKKVFEDINRSNRLLSGNRVTIQSVAKLVADYPQESYTILDVGCGDGTMLRKLVLWARNRKIKIKCVGIDLSEKGLTIADEMSQHFPEIRYLKQDILNLEPAHLHCDILLCTLTMHHFLNHQIPVFLGKFGKLAHIAVVINDLHRSALAYYLFNVFSLIFVRTEIAKRDGLISIQSGFTKSELIAFSRNLPLLGHDIKWKWAFRYVWVMRTKRLK